MKNEPSPTSRRNFLKGTAVAGSFAIATNAKSYANIVGSNESLQMGVVGFRGRGKALINGIDQAKGAKLVGLCDVDRNVLSDFRAKDKDLIREEDVRELLGRDDIDAIASATPNHWHAIVTCWASDAGKHVYIEKPISHNMMESRKIVEAAQRNQTLIQGGFQNRSDTGLLTFFENLRGGKYGDVVSVHGTCHRQRASIGKLDQALKIPPQVNFDLWLGPASDQPILRPSLHYDWHWDFNTGNGDVGNQGPHEWDMMNWALGDSDNLPKTMIAAGNRFGWNDAGDTPNVMACAGVSNDIPFCFEVMDLKGGRRAPFGRGVGVIIETTQGRFVGGRGGGTFTHQDGTTEKFKRDQTQAKSDGTPSHMQNFVEAVQAGDRGLLRSDCSIAANSSAMAHMANISFQLGGESSPEKLEAAFGKSVQQRDMLARLRESVMLFNANQDGDGSQVPWLLGPALSFDAAGYQFTGPDSDRANALMTRDYRKGYEI